MLPPYPPTTPLPGGVLPKYQCIGKIIDDVLYTIVELQIQLEKQEDPSIQIQIDYHRALMEYWCDVYLDLYGEGYQILIC